MIGRFLTAVIWVNIAIVAAFHLLNVVMAFVTDGFWGGLGLLQDIYSPFNIINWLVTIATLLPAIGALWLRGKLKDRGEREGGATT